MFRIAICDDEKLICSQIENIILHNRAIFLDEIELEIFNSGEELFENISKGEIYELIFLDIELLSMDGIEVGKKIRGDIDDQLTQIVYISGKEIYYKELFEIRPMHFILKPFDEEKIIADVKLAMKLVDNKGKVFMYKLGHRTIRVPLREIIYFEAKGRQVKMVTKTDAVQFYKSIGEIYQELSNSNFVNIHKSFVVNYFHIVEFGYKSVRMSNDETLPISQQKRKEVVEFQLRFEEGV
jgi:DNA-binding LytR/AlgR family response regulator